MRWRLFRSNADEFERELIDEVITESVALDELLDPDESKRLRELTDDLAQTKLWEATRGFELTNEMIIVIAANAALPILNLGLSYYRSVRSIIIRESTAHSTSLRSGPMDGVVSDEPIETIGMATHNEGPVSISWDAAVAQSRHPEHGRNVVIHEFAHKIDMSDGFSDGTPPLRGQPLVHWSAVLADEYERTKSRPSDEALRPYAWTNRAEFFAVASEAFFCTPTMLAEAKPELYDALASFYRQDPSRKSRLR